MVTSNHIHLLAMDNCGRNVIPDSIKLVAGRTGQEYNVRKNRKGAFWEDRYHATAVEKSRYLRKCITYIDLNMVRAGVVEHPGQWEFCGYWVDSEIQTKKSDKENKWTQSIAVGSKTFVEKMKEALGFRAKGRKIICADDSFELREVIAPYGKATDQDSGNTYLWNP
jgi:putative transposase